MRQYSVHFDCLLGHRFHEIHERHCAEHQSQTLSQGVGGGGQVTAVGSLFRSHCTEEEIVDYRNVIRADSQMRQALFTGLLNEGILLQTGTAGALNTLTTESEIDALVDTTRRVVQRVR